MITNALGAVKDPLFGITNVPREEIDPSLKGTEEGKELVLSNAGFGEVFKTITSGKSKPITDPGLRHLSLLTLHDSAYGIGGCTFSKYEADTGTDPSLYPMDMKDCYNLCGDGSLLQQVADDFVLSDVYKYTGMSLGDWLNTTRVEQNIIKTAIGRKKNIEIEVSESINNEIANSKERKKNT